MAASPDVPQPGLPGRLSRVVERDHVLLDRAGRLGRALLPVDGVLRPV